MILYKISQCFFWENNVVNHSIKSIYGKTEVVLYQILQFHSRQKNARTIEDRIRTALL